MSTVRDLRREHFSDLPEPVPETKVKHEILGDKYMDALERYINQLSQHVRKIQDEELMVTNQFSLALSSLQTKSHDKRRMREDVAREVYQKKIAKIREKRKRFREMLYDAQSERKKLIDSMQIQKDEDDILRRKLAKLSALTAAETSREQRQTSKFDKFALLFMLLQVMLFIIYGLAFDFSADATSYNARGAPGSGSRAAGGADLPVLHRHHADGGGRLWLPVRVPAQVLVLGDRLHAAHGGVCVPVGRDCDELSQRARLQLAHRARHVRVAQRPASRRSTCSSACTRRSPC
jgi:hypothetical protein